MSFYSPSPINSWSSPICSKPVRTVSSSWRRPLRTKFIWHVSKVCPVWRSRNRSLPMWCANTRSSCAPAMRQPSRRRNDPNDDPRHPEVASRRAAHRAIRPLPPVTDTVSTVASVGWRCRISVVFSIREQDANSNATPHRWQAKIWVYLCRFAELI